MAENIRKKEFSSEETFISERITTRTSLKSLGRQRSMSFCRITGKSRGLPKPNYFPLLPPISPADAKRFCKITGKSYGLPTHHYIPVALGFHQAKSQAAARSEKCKITTKSSGLEPHHYTAGLVLDEKKKHIVLENYRYVFPILDGKGEQHEALKNLLDSKKTLKEEEQLKFVYTVKERRCSLVFPAQLEAAVRDGDVKDVMLSKDCDTIFLRLKQGKNVSVDFADLTEFDELYDGYGPREDIYKERQRAEAESKKRKKKRQAGLSYAKKIFEDKEKAEEEEELKITKQVKLRSLRKDKKQLLKWKQAGARQEKSRRSIVTNSIGCKNIKKPLSHSLDYKVFENDVNSLNAECTTLIKDIPSPIKINPQVVDLEKTPLGTYNTPVSNETSGFEAIAIVEPFVPLVAQPESYVQQAIKNISSEDLKGTVDVNKKFLAAGSEALHNLPKIEEIPSLIENINSGEKAEIHQVKGLKVDTKAFQRFVAGQTVQTPTGEVFVPGQSLETKDGITFVPGITVNTPQGPQLIPGQILSVKEENGKGISVFVAGQTLPTDKGEIFVQGQTIHTYDGSKFVVGQTVLTKEGPKFVAGQVVGENKFIPGQLVTTQDGTKFVPGQTITDDLGQMIFVPGQSHQVNKNWEFIPGQCLKMEDGREEFVPGQTILMTNGLQFVPGQNVITETGESRFVPGITVKSDNDMKFIAGMTLDTPCGTKFVEGQIVKVQNEEKFVCGSTIRSESGCQFVAAKNSNEINYCEPLPSGISIDPKSTTAVCDKQSKTFGHIIQTDNGIEFIPENVKIMSHGKKVIPGQLVRDEHGHRFIPGIITDDGFLPGQMVNTEKGEQFVPGQVIDTNNGPKFIPGQMVETRSGLKFVPGQTFVTPEGPQFVPGQIVETKVGPTFIPGQIISTEDEGSRFVPGQVVNTPDGPRFVPGKVVESTEHGIIFVPGQIVQTEEGPKFVAPDLIDTPEGELEFSVQGFEVTPEELKLLRPQNFCYNAFTEGYTEASIDTNMLKQLSDAGLSIGKSIPTKIPTVDVNVDSKTAEFDHAIILVEKLGLQGNLAIQMAQIISIIVILASKIINQEFQNAINNKFQHQNGHDSSISNGQLKNFKNITNGNDDWIRDVLKSTLLTAVTLLMSNEVTNECNGDEKNNNCNGNGNSSDIISAENYTNDENKRDVLFLAIIETLQISSNHHSINFEHLIEDVLKTLLLEENRNLICEEIIREVFPGNGNKIDILKSTFSVSSSKNEIIIDRLSQILEKESGNNLIGSALKTVSDNDPELISKVLKNVSENVTCVESEKDAVNVVHGAIIRTVQEYSEGRLEEVLNDDDTTVHELLLQAVGLAKALGLTSTVSSLLAIIDDPETFRALSSDKIALDILKRLLVMKKLAERRPNFQKVFDKLGTNYNVETANSDPCLRTLVRESAVLMTTPEEVPKVTSKDIPTSLFYAKNSLAIEDFMIKNNCKPSAACMILKQGLQAVVPREAARSVLTGEIAYTVLDEQGIQYFEPLHVFSALRLSKHAIHRFSMYNCPVIKTAEKNTETESELMSYTEFSFSESPTSSLDNFTLINSRKEDSSIGIDLSKSSETLKYRSPSRENTPSFRRISNFCQDDTVKSENYVVVKDFTGEGGISVNVGDIVEAIEFAADNSKEMTIDPTLDVGKIESLLDNSAARHKLSIRPRRKYVDSRALLNFSDSSRILIRKVDGKEGWLPTSILMQTALSEDSTSQHKPEDSRFRREAVVKELVETEEEFGRDLQAVVERYLKPLDNPDVPRVVRDNKEVIFTNLKQIAEFHNTVLIEGVKYYADQPRMLGKTFLRLERDFDKHVSYCKDEPAAQEFLQLNDNVREYFEELSQKLGDDKSLSEHLKLPIQRINDYQLLLKELVKYSARLGEDCDDLQKALELMLGIPHRATDNKFISNIEGYKGNIHKLGRLLTHEWFTVTDKEGKSKERYLFLFKARILVCKVRRISEDRSVFVLKEIIRLPEVEVKDHPEDQRTFELHLKPGAEQAGSHYPITLSAHKDPVKSDWLQEIRLHASDVVALAEHAADDLQLTDTVTEQPQAQPAADMSRRYSSSSRAISASTKTFVEESTSITTISNGSSQTATQVLSATSSSFQQIDGSTGAVSESSSSFKRSSAVTGDANVIETETKKAKLALGATETGKPQFQKTIEGCQVEPSRAKMAMLHVIAGECATFECTLQASDSITKMLWLKDNKPMDDKLADRVKTTTDGKSFKLQIENVSESDSGLYIARAANDEGQATCTAQLVVQELTAEEKKARADANSPIFLVRLKDTELLENTYLRFMIKVKGDPNPDLKFYKDGVLIDSKNERVKIVSDKADKGFYEIVIPNVQNEDAGKYSCTAQNRFGEASCEANVTVTDEKLMFTGLPEGLLEPGEEPKFVWTRDGVPFDPEERFKVLFKDSEDTLALVFQHVKPEDAGLYTCVAQTSTGNISCSAELTVQGTVNQLLKEPTKPVLQSEAKTSEVSAGGSAMLDLQVKGYPKPDIKWTKDGQEIVAGGRIKYLWEDEESLSLVIKNVTAQDAGIYKIRAKNELGEDNTQIELIVKSAPKITKRMSDLSVQAGETIKMSVQIQGSPAPDVKWYKNNQIIQESDRVKISKEADDTYTLVIKNASLEDAGSYSIVAKNEINETSQFWDLTVKYPPKITKKLGEPRLIEESDSLTLYIEVESDYPTEVIWMKDEEIVKKSERVELIEEGSKYSLNISRLIDSDTATYKVLVSNKDGQTSDQTKIQVRSAPLFRKKLEDVVAKESEENIELVVEIDSFSKPEVKWYFGKTEITESKKEYKTSESGNTYKLVIAKAKTEVAGKYTCKAQNEVGESNTTANLTVYYRPKLIKKLADQKVKEGETLKLTVQVQAVPAPEIKWYKDGQEVSADARIKITRDSQRLENYDLTVTVLKGSDGGVYEVRATNELGFVSSKSKVIVLTTSEETIEEKGGAEEEEIKKTKVEEEKSVKEEDVSAEKQNAEVSDQEGHLKVEKRNVEVIKNSEGNTITISVASTTEYEATSTGPDERHTIGKMTATKVEVEEKNTCDNGPLVEEIASYRYTIQEDECWEKQVQNGMLVEEFSESEEGKDKEDKDKLKGQLSNTSINRGISIVSISDDDAASPVKGISRDVSSDDIQHHKITINRGVSIVSVSDDDAASPKGVSREESTDDVQQKSKPIVSDADETSPNSGKLIKPGQQELFETRSFRMTETIIEEHICSPSLEDESLTDDASVKTQKISSRLVEESSATIEEQFSRKNISNSELNGKQNGIIENSSDSELTKEYLIKRKSISSSNGIATESDDVLRSKIQTAEKDTTELTKHSLQKRRSISSPEKIQNGILTSQRQRASLTEVIDENSISNRSSRKNSIDDYKERRQSKEFKRFDSIDVKYIQEEILPDKRPLKGIKTEIEEDEDEEMKKLFERIKRQRSVLDEILDKQDSYARQDSRGKLSRQESIAEDTYCKQDSEDKCSQKESQDNFEKQESVDKYGRRESEDKYLRQDSRDKLSRQESKDHYRKQDNEDSYSRQDSRNKFDKQDSQDKYSRQESQDKYSRQESQDKYSRQNSEDKYSRQESQDKYSRQESQDKNSRRNSEDKYGRQNSEDKYSRQNSEDKYSRQESQDKYSRQESQDKYSRQNSEDKYSRQESQDKYSRQESQDKNSRRNSEDKYGRQNSEDKYSRQNSEDKYSRQESQDKYSRQESQDKYSRQNSEDKYSRQESQDKYSRQESQDKNSRRNSEDKYGRQNSEDKYSRQNSEDKYGRIKSEDKYSRQNSEDNYGRQKGEDNYSRQNSEDKYGRQKSDDKYSRQNSEDKYSRQDSHDKYSKQDSQDKLNGQDSKNKCGRQDSQDKYSQQDSQEKFDSNDSKDKYGRQDSQEKLNRQDSKDKYGRKDSQEKLNRQDSKDKYGRQDSQEKLNRQDSKDKYGRKDSQEKLNRQDSKDKYGRQDSQEKLNRQDSKDKYGKQDSQEKLNRQDSKDKYGRKDSQEKLNRQDSKDKYDRQDSDDKYAKQDIQNKIDRQESQDKSDSQNKLGRQMSEDKYVRQDSKEKFDREDSQHKLNKQESEDKYVRQDSREKLSRQESKEKYERQDSKDKLSRQDSQNKLNRQESKDEKVKLDKQVRQDKQGDTENEASPIIVSSTLEDRDIFATQSTVYEVKVTGLPRPEAKWFKDGKPLKISKRVQYTTVGEVFQLSFNKALEEDSGLYTVVFTNKLGEKSLEGFLNVEPPDELKRPKLNEPLQDADVDQGKNAIFKAVITGDPIPVATWKWNNELIDEDASDRHRTKVESKVVEDSLKQCTYTLEILNCLPEDVGNYTLKVENEYGEVSTNADLNLRIIPIIEEFKDLRAPAGETILWEAIIKANPKPTVVWQCDGRDVTLDSRFSTEDDYKQKKYMLKIKNLEVCDGGNYKIIVTNDMGEATAEATLKPFTEAPAFTKELKDYESVRDQNNYEAEVRVTGYPRPTITWFKNGVEIYEDMRNTMTATPDGPEMVAKYIIERFGEQDAGIYTCQATNMVGSIKTETELTLTRFPPKFFRSLPPALDLDQGEPLELFAKCDGSPIPSVGWYKDGELIVPDDHTKIDVLPDGTMRLFIEHVKPTDSGAYKVVAANTGGNLPSQCAVAVRPESKKPYFKKSLEDVKAKVGEPLKLEVQVVAFPNPEVQWFKDGLPIRPSKEIYFSNDPNGLIGLTIDKLRPEDAGLYSLVVSNDLGEITGTSQVEVEETETTPAFVATLHPTTVVEGFPAKLEVKSIGKPAPALKWTHNGQEITPDGQHLKIVEMPDGSQALLIDKCGPADSGEYAVVASNSQGEEISKAPLVVKGKLRAGEPEEKPQLVSPLRDASFQEGQPLSLQALITGNPTPDVSWTKDGKPIQPSERVVLSCDGKKIGLEINPCSAEDAGTYGCELRNPLGTDKGSANVNVRKVNQTPHFAQKLTDLQQMMGCDAKFCARVSGIPQPDISWFFNDAPINPGDGSKYKLRRDGDVCCLYVKDCTYGDSGRYKCRATNKAGTADSDATLSVVKELDKKQKCEPPSFLKRVGDCEVYKGMTAKFTACVTGYPEPEYEWYRDDTKLWPTERILMEDEGAGLLRLSIYHVDEDDAGKYTLRIFNPYGEDKSTGEMIFESIEPRNKKLVDQYADLDRYRKSGIPLPLADRPIISRMMDRHLTLSWKPSIPSMPRVPVTYQVEMCELPDGDWFTARTGVRGCVCDIRNLIPFRDYRFRIRVENKYGISEPSPYAQTYRAKLEPDPPKFYPYLPPGIDFRPETSPYFPKDFDIERPPHDNYAQAPRFLRQEFDTQYGVKNQNSKLFWFVYGYPKPKMQYYFEGKLIETGGGRFDCTYTRNGQATLFVNKMLERDVGEYEAVATNEHGEARQKVRLEIAEYPTFIQRPEETHTILRKTVKLEARVTGVPYPELKWYKDWKPLAASTRIKILFVEPDLSILTIEDAIQKDEGLYSISARNVAGCASSSAMLHVGEDELDWRYKNYAIKAEVEARQKNLADDYDLGDELGRGTQGVVYHAVERSTGKNFAAKVMHGRAELKTLMHNELEALNNLNHRNILRLHDAYETDRSLSLVTELAGGGELVDNITKNPYYNESDIARYIRQLLTGLDYIHKSGWAHLGLTLGDLLISHPGGEDLKIADFGLARRIIRNKLMTLMYGMPEFVPPEVPNGEGVDYGADMWSTGIITYILLSGISPFRGINDRETLTKIKEGKWNFDDDRWSKISDEAKDFIKKLLEYQTERRMDTETALRHPWLRLADLTPDAQEQRHKIPSENLKNYYGQYRDWYKNASCRTWYRRRRLSNAFEHPSKMVYPPGHKYTPERSPERARPPSDKKSPSTWEHRIPSREPIDTEIGIIKSESHYQNGPDTYLLQLRDTDFPVRLREYMKVAQNRGTGFPRVFSDDAYDWRTPVIRERRRFTDIMDEEIDDERKARINNYGGTAVDAATLRRLRHELGTRLDSYAEVEALMQEARQPAGGQLPFFREKPQSQPIRDGEPARLSCLAVGNPQPLVQWFRNDCVVMESNRTHITEDADGRSVLSLEPAREHDAGLYKVVARNKLGQTVARARLVAALPPCAPDSPEAADASDSEILLRWRLPRHDGHAPVLCYSLQIREGDAVEWRTLADNIDHEFFLASGLEPNTSYSFRLAARNRIGWSEHGVPTRLIKTRAKQEAVPPVRISPAMRHLQQLTESGRPVAEDGPGGFQQQQPGSPAGRAWRLLDYEQAEAAPADWIREPGLLAERYSFVSEVSRGRFSLVAKGIERASDRVVVAKILERRPEREAKLRQEFEMLRSLRHERICLLEAAYLPEGSPVAALVLEKLQGADVLSFLASRHEYTENCVASVVAQVLDGLQYLHWRGICHLDIQPDNVVMASLRSVQVKIVDLGSARRVSRLGQPLPEEAGEELPGHPEYASPEVLNREPIFPQSDIWQLGVLTYVLLSGVSPFRGNDATETRQNISFVRYRFEYLYKELSQEATRFFMLLFKRSPSKRPTAEECHEHRWLMPTDYMIKKRERSVFLGNRLKDYNEEYHEEKRKRASEHDKLSEAFGTAQKLARSNSIQDELLTTF